MASLYARRFNYNSYPSCFAKQGDKAQCRNCKTHNNHLASASISCDSFRIHKKTGMHR